MWPRAARVVPSSLSQLTFDRLGHGGCSQSLAAVRRGARQQHAQQHGHPFIIAGDFQNGPKAMIDSGFLDLIGGVIVSPPSGSCRSTATGEYNLIDYFIWQYKPRVPSKINSFYIRFVYIRHNTDMIVI